jgi:hypothetical protein
MRAGAFAEELASNSTLLNPARMQGANNMATKTAAIRKLCIGTGSDVLPESEWGFRLDVRISQSGAGYGFGQHGKGPCC